MFTTHERSITRWIDEAQQLCQPATGRELAKRLGMTEPNLSQCKTGLRKFSKDQIERLAAVLEIDPRLLWQQQAAEEWERAKGQRGFVDLAALLVAFLVAVLLAGAIGLNPSQPTRKSQKFAGDSLHIVARLRQIALRLSRAFKHLQPGPMALEC